MPPSFRSVSVVLIVSDEPPSLDLLEQFYEALERLFLDVEFVIIANGVDPGVSLQLKALSGQLPDSLVVFLGDRVHGDVARLIGIDHAVSDYVLFATPTAVEVESVGLFEAPLHAGCDLVIGRPHERVRRGLVNRALFTGFRLMFRWTTGRVFEDAPATFRILDRAAALYVATRKEGEVLVRARSLGSSFPAGEVNLPADEGRRSHTRSLRSDLARGARFITTGSTKLLRASSYLALSGGVLSAIYALYVIFIFITDTQVEPGWTTMSLQLSGMMLLFSVQFLLLSEHVVQITAHGALSQRRQHVIRTVRSPMSRRSRRLNVVDEEGRFELGAPAQFGQPIMETPRS